MPDGVVVDPVLRQRFSFERSTEADGGEVLRVEIWVEAGGGVTPHVHPAMEERFHVVSGRPSFLSGREWLAAAPGEDVVVPSGARHAYRNGSEDVAHIVCEARPPSLLQEFLEDARRPRASGEAHPPGPAEESECPAPGSGDGSRLPRDGGAWLPSHAAAVSAAAGLPPLAHLGRRRGYRSGTFAALA